MNTSDTRCSSTRIHINDNNNFITALDACVEAIKACMHNSGYLTSSLVYDMKKGAIKLEIMYINFKCMSVCLHYENLQLKFAMVYVLFYTESDHVTLHIL